MAFPVGVVRERQETVTWVRIFWLCPAVGPRRHSGPVLGN